MAAGIPGGRRDPGCKGLRRQRGARSTAFGTGDAGRESSGRRFLDELVDEQRKECSECCAALEVLEERRKATEAKVDDLRDVIVGFCSSGVVRDLQPQLAAKR